MHKSRAIVVLVATAIGFVVSFVMLREALGANSPWLGLFLMFTVLGLAKVAEPLFMLRMPGPLRSLRAWERTGKVYRPLGVNAFGRLLRGTPLHYLNRSVYLAQQRADMQGVLRLVESAEASHFWAALVLVPYVAIALESRQYAVAIVFALVEVFFNFYPILHLRCVRERLASHAVAAGRRRRFQARVVR